MRDVVYSISLNGALRPGQGEALMNEAVFFHGAGCPGRADQFA